MKNRPGTSRIFGAVLALGAMLGLRRQAAAVVAPVGAPTPPSSPHHGIMPSRIQGDGATPDVWGQSQACRQMVRKNKLAARGRS